MIKRSLALSAVLALGFAARAEAASFTRNPYVQDVTPDSAVIAFRTDAACAATVRFGPNGDLSKTATDDATTKHEIKLTGLSAGTPHAYQVEACGAQSSATFVAAPPANAAHAHFAAMGDFGSGGSAEVAVGRALKAANPEMVVALGDNAYENGTQADFQQHLFEPLADLLSGVPMFASLGNHEYNTDQAAAYVDNFVLPTNDKGNERYYSFDWGPVHLVALDSNCVPDYTATAASCTIAAQQAWLEKDLAATEKPWKIAFFHHPPWSSGEHGSATKVRAAFGPILEKHGVDLVLNGHDHDYERTVPMLGDGPAPSGAKGIPYVVVGTGGAKLTQGPGAPPAWSAKRFFNVPGYLDLDVNGGTLTTTFKSEAGETLDTLTLTKDVKVTMPEAGGTIPSGTKGDTGSSGGTIDYGSSGSSGGESSGNPGASGCATIPAAGVVGLLAAFVKRRKSKR